jgi:hypothetical protein
MAQPVVRFHAKFLLWYTLSNTVVNIELLWPCFAHEFLPFCMCLFISSNLLLLCLFLSIYRFPSFPFISYSFAKHNLEISNHDVGFEVFASKWIFGSWSSGLLRRVHLWMYVSVSEYYYASIFRKAHISPEGLVYSWKTPQDNSWEHDGVNSGQDICFICGLLCADAVNCDVFQETGQ